MSERAVAAPARMTIRTLVDELARVLAAAGIADGRVPARDIVAALVGEARSWPTANGDAPADESLRERAASAVRALAGGAPIVYAVGVADFRHLTLEVDERVLIPRPETELLVDLVLGELGGAAAARGVVIDVGTGSGALALALASEGSFDRVIATDVSLDALAVAARNVERLRDKLRCDVELRHGSLLAPVAGVRADVIVSNPPYIATGEAAELPPSVRDFEPPSALFSGHDGLAATRRLVAEAVGVLQPRGLLAVEVDARRASLVAEMIARDVRYAAVRVALDLTGRERFVLARRQETE